jgi:predicted PurR-regulated permease PerM
MTVTGRSAEDRPDRAEASDGTGPRIADSQSTRLTIILVLIISGLVATFLARDVLTPVIVGGLVAFLVAPLVRWLDARMPMGLAIVISYLIFIAGSIFLIFLVPVLFIQSIGEIDLGAIFASIDDWAIGLLESLTTINVFGATVDLSAVTQPAIEAIQNASPPSVAVDGSELRALLSGALQATAGLFGVVASLVGFWVFTLLIGLYLSGSGARYAHGAVRIFPKRYRSEVSALGKSIVGVWNAYIRGEFAMAVIIGITTGTVAWLIGIPGAFGLGLIAGVLEVIPTFGPIIATIPAVLVALVQGSTRFDMNNIVFALLVILAYILIQQLESQLVAPRVLGDAVQLPALVVLLAITVGFQVAGVLGAILAVPTVATARVLTRYGWAKATGVDLSLEPPERARPEDDGTSMATSRPAPTSSALEAGADPPTLMPETRAAPPS